MHDIFAPVSDYIQDAHLVAWDGCHKIYMALDATEAAWFKGEYPHVVNGTPAEMIAAIEKWWSESCGLRFINGVRHNPSDPNAGYVQIVPQFADENE